MKKLLLILFSTLILSNINSQDFEVAPVLIKFTAEPGEMQKQTLNLINHSNKKQKYNFVLSDFTFDENGNKKSAPMGTTPRSCANWLTISPSFVELNPNEQASINVMINVPKGQYSSKWGIIYVQAATEQTAISADKNLATGVVLVPRIAIYVTQSPKTNTKYKATINGFKEVTSTNDELKTFEASIQNTGDKLIEAKVFIAVANLNTASETKYPNIKTTVFPDQIKKETLTIPEKLLPGKYVIAVMLDYGHMQPIESSQVMIEVK